MKAAVVDGMQAGRHAGVQAAGSGERAGGGGSQLELLGRIYEMRTKKSRDDDE